VEDDGRQGVFEKSVEGLFLGDVLVEPVQIVIDVKGGEIRTDGQGIALPDKQAGNHDGGGAVLDGVCLAS